MPLAIPAELKKISPYIRRAEELDKDKTSPESRLVAYYCRQYAVHVGIPLSSSSAEAKTCLGHILESLEKEKAAMDNFTRDEAAFLCRKFATSIFDKADSEDRAGQASKNTAKTFYAAASFLQILEQFTDDNDLSEEAAEDRKRIIYSKWKATEILKAIKEGRQPTPGGYGQDEEMGEQEVGSIEIKAEKESEKKEDAPPTVETVEEDNNSGVEIVHDKVEDDFLPPPAPVSMMPAPTPLPPPPADNEDEDEVAEENSEVEGEDEGMEVELGPPPAYPGPETNSKPKPPVDRPKLSFDMGPPVAPKPLSIYPPAKPPSPKPKKSIFGFAKKQPSKISKAQMSDAIELTRFALAALEDKDAELGAERLQQALQALGR